MRSNIEFITYGFFVDLDKIRPIERKNNRLYLNKPNSGLWASPVDSRYGWKDWCSQECFRTNDFGVYTKWKLKPGTKILVINTIKDFLSAMDKYRTREEGDLSYFPRYYLDFYRIMKDGYSGVYLTELGSRVCHYGIRYEGNYTDLNAWDCESIVVWDKDKIKIIEKGRII